MSTNSTVSFAKSQQRHLLPSRPVATPAPLPTPLARILEILKRTNASLRQGKMVDDDLVRIHDLLERLPLSTDEFGLLCNRLRNAARYARSGEAGAANWELVALRNMVSRLDYPAGG